MKFLVSFLLIGLLPLVYSQSCPRIDYDYYLLSMTWRNTFCATNKCRKNIENNTAK